MSEGYHMRMHPMVRLIASVESNWSRDRDQAHDRAVAVVKSLIEAKAVQGYIQGGLPCEYPPEVLEANRP